MIYDEILSLGSNCAPALSLRELHIKKETYPFDWVRSNAKIVYSVLKEDMTKYYDFNSIKSFEYFLRDLHSITHKKFSNEHVNYFG